MVGCGGSGKVDKSFAIFGGWLGFVGGGGGWLCCW